MYSIRLSEPASERFESTLIGSVSVFGLSHRSAPADFRRSARLSEEGARSVISSLSKLQNPDLLVLSTCNRTEIYSFGFERDTDVIALAQATGLDEHALRRNGYWLCGHEAVRHLFGVASGLDSAILGEHEILGQLKRAYALSKETEAISGPLDRLMQQVFRVAKRVRAESGLARGVLSYGALALKKAANLSGGLQGKTILILGAGQIAEQLAKEIGSLNDTTGLIWNRTPAKAANLAHLYGLHCLPSEEINQGFAQADIVIGAVAGSNLWSLNEISEARNGQPTLVMDLGVPPNFQETQTEHPALQIVTADTISVFDAKHSDARAVAVRKAWTLIDQELEDYERDCREREAAPYIEAIAERAEQIRSRNLERAVSQAGDLEPEERKRMEDLSIRIVRGLLETPIQALKTHLRAPHEREVVARLFGSDPVEQYGS
jgi:glutamyl-tRNA reductase